MSATPPGIRDVAAAAGVSVTTVSDALNGKGRISQATRDRVHRVAHQLGYRPSSLARSLRAGQTRLLGLLVTKYGQTAWAFTRLPYFATAIDAAVSAALDRGYAMTVLPAEFGADAVLSFPLDGLLVLDPLTADPIVAAARRRGVPVVADLANAVSAEDPWIDFDHEAAMDALCNHLIAERERSPVLLTSDGDDSYTAACRAGYQRWCERQGKRPVVVRGSKDLDETRAVVRAMLTAPGRPDAVVGLEDYHGSILAEEAQRAGLDQSDLALGSFTEADGGPAGLPPVARVTVNPQLQGRNGVALLVDAVEGRPMRPELRLVPATLLT